MFSLPAVLTFVFLTASGLTLDLWSKSCVFQTLLAKPDVVEYAKQHTHSLSSPEVMLRDRGDHKPLAEERVLGKIKFTLSTNPGVVFGLEMPPAVVAVVSVITIAMVFFFFASGDARAWAMHVALAFILAGALGNLYDRLLGAVCLPGMDNPIRHQVRDFINLGDIHFLPFKIGEYDNYPWIFNVADVLLVAGVLLLMLNWFLHRNDERSKGDERGAKGETAKT
jgi:lipoprotein signal peptidase